MDFLDKLKCPQYVSFNCITDNNDSILKDLEDSPSGFSVKDDVEAEYMDSQDENSYVQDQACSESLQSPLCESYLENTDDTSMQASPYSSCQTEDFPINRPRNLSLTENGLKKKKKVAKTTKVQPFHFMESKKRKREGEKTETHVPLAEQVAAFQKKTPERFHTTGPKSFEPTEHWSPHLVIPKSPNLRAAKRQRRVDVISREEQEQQEAEEIKRYRFRARPLNQNLLNRPHIPQIRKKTPTKAKNLKLRTAERAAEIHAKKKLEDKPYEFHARPVPKAILNGPVGLKEKTSLPVTQPKTPNFALKSRAEKWKSQDKVNETITVTDSQIFKANPAPAPSSPFLVKYEKKPTIPEPFSFDSRDKERMAQKEKKIQEIIEKENVFVFKAQPMPSPAPSALPPVPKKQPTQPQPFSFLLEERSSRHNSFNSTFDQTCPIFKAQPAKVLEKPPFIPEKPEKQPLEIIEFNLHTDIRAAERQKLKEIQDMKEREKELILQRQKELEEERERQEIQKLRKEIVHKANPIRHFKNVEIKPCPKLPAIPLSPKFKTDERLQMRH